MCILMIIFDVASYIFWVLWKKNDFIAFLILFKRQTWIFSFWNKWCRMFIHFPFPSLWERGILTVPFQLWHGSSVFTLLSHEQSSLVASDTKDLLENLLWNYSKPGSLYESRENKEISIKGNIFKMEMWCTQIWKWSSHEANMYIMKYKWKWLCIFFKVWETKLELL